MTENEMGMPYTPELKPETCAPEFITTESVSGDEETPVSAPPPLPAQKGGGWVPGLVAGLLLVVLGMAMLFIAAVFDIVNVSEKPWNSALLVFDVPENLPNIERYPIRARLVSRAERLEEDMALQLLEQLVSWERFEQPVRLSDPELVVALDMPLDMLTPLLASGRLPEPGKPEVLAGSLARDHAFLLDEVEFKVVGRLENWVSGFLFAYLLPHGADFEELFVSEMDVIEGLLVIPGLDLIQDGLLPERPFRTPLQTDAEEEDTTETDAASEDEADLEDEMEEEMPLTLPPYIGGLMLAQSKVTHLAMAGLLLAAIGGAIAYFALFKLLRLRQYRPLLPILDEIMARPLLFWGMHLLLYGTFFVSMFISLKNPLITYRITQYIEAVFSHGGLGYIGWAYASGNVSLAAWATFYNNYIEQTLGLTFFISLFPIPFGLIKNLLSFSLVGGAMAPTWVGTSNAYLLHSITMALELQGYIVACFAITAWPLHLYEGLKTNTVSSRIKSGLLMLFSATLLTAAMLGVAAIYEAITLIHMMGM